MAFNIPVNIEKDVRAPYIAYRKEDGSIGTLLADPDYSPEANIAAALEDLNDEAIRGKPLMVFQGGKV